MAPKIETQMTESDYGWISLSRGDGRTLQHGAMEEGYWERICDGLTLRRMFETAIGDST